MHQYTLQISVCFVRLGLIMSKCDCIFKMHSHYAYILCNIIHNVYNITVDAVGEQYESVA